MYDLCASQIGSSSLPQFSYSNNVLLLSSLPAFLLTPFRVFRPIRAAFAFFRSFRVSFVLWWREQRRRQRDLQVSIRQGPKHEAERQQGAADDQQPDDEDGGTQAG